MKHHAGALAIGGFVRRRWRGGRGGAPLRETSLAEMALQEEPTATRTATASGNEASSGTVVVH
jgi:hypothetical protein